MYGSSIDHVHVNERGSSAEVLFVWTDAEGIPFTIQLHASRTMKSSDTAEILHPLELMLRTLVGSDIEPGEIEQKFTRAQTSATS